MGICYSPKGKESSPQAWHILSTPPSDCSSLPLRHSAEAALSPLSTLPSSPRGTGLLLPCLQKETAQAQRTQRLGLSHGTSGRVGIQGEEVWLQSLGSDPQTQQSLPY